VHASTPSAVEAELLSGARMWASKNRPDMARQLVDKVLAMDPYSPQGLGTLGDLALREKKMDEAKRILDTLRSRHPGHAVTQELETLVRVYGSEREKLSQMRLMARAGRKAEAADLARELFPQGPPTLGGLALEYHQILGSSTKRNADSLRQLGKLYQETGESRYRLAQLEMRMYQGENPTTVVQEIESLAKQPDVNAQQLQDLWRRAMDRLANTSANLPRVRAFCSVTRATRPWKIAWPPCNRPWSAPPERPATPLTWHAMPHGQLWTRATPNWPKNSSRPHWPCARAMATAWATSGSSVCARVNMPRLRSCLARPMR